MRVWLFRHVPLLIAVWMWTLWLNFPVVAQDMTPMPALADQPLTNITFGQLASLALNLGLGVIVFIVWLFDARRMTKLEELIRKYEAALETMQKAFAQINDRNMTAFTAAMEQSQKVAEDSRDTAILCAQVNAKLVEKMEHMEKEHRP